jgi:two-component system sensor histidine kinase YesM
MLDRFERLIEEINLTNEQSVSRISNFTVTDKPHFLYNTLDSISWNAIDKNVPEISVMLNKLSKLYRSILNKEGNFVPLSRKLST